MRILSADEVASFYRNSRLDVPSHWNLGRKHLRIETLNHKFLKLNKFENRINPRELRKYCVKYKPLHVYMSVLDWLFPERVGKKYKARYAWPIGGEFVVDVDCYVPHKLHHHLYSNTHLVCIECLEIAKQAAIDTCEKIEEHYSDVVINFSGRRGFHIHVLDFEVKDWTYYNNRGPIKSHEVARYKFCRKLAHNTVVYDRARAIFGIPRVSCFSIVVLHVLVKSSTYRELA